MRNESDENTRLVMELKRDGHRQGRHHQSLQAHAAGEFRSASTRSRLTMAGRRRSISRKSSSATSSTAAKSFCAARGLNCRRPRNAPNCSKVISSRWRISTNSSTSSAVSKNARRSARQTARVRVDARAGRTMGHFDPQRGRAWTNGPLRADRAAGGRDSGIAPLSIDRAGN